MTIPALSLAVLSLMAAFAFLFFRLASRSASKAISPEWLRAFSLESYAPMRRLLAECDFEFLAKQPGYHPGLAKRLRAERRTAFLGYLELMIADFNQLLNIGRHMLVGSSVDRPDFARALSRQQFKFYFAVYALRCRLAISPLSARLQGGELLDSLGNMFQQVRELASVEAAA